MTAAELTSRMSGKELVEHIADMQITADEHAQAEGTV